MPSSTARGRGPLGRTLMLRSPVVGHWGTSCQLSPVLLQRSALLGTRSTTSWSTTAPRGPSPNQSIRSQVRSSSRYPALQRPSAWLWTVHPTRRHTTARRGLRRKVSPTGGVQRKVAAPTARCSPLGSLRSHAPRRRPVSPWTGLTIRLPTPGPLGDSRSMWTRGDPYKGPWSLTSLAHRQPSVSEREA